MVDEPEEVIEFEDEEKERTVVHLPCGHIVDSPFKHNPPRQGEVGYAMCHACPEVWKMIRINERIDAIRVRKENLEILSNTKKGFRQVQTSEGWVQRID